MRKITAACLSFGVLFGNMMFPIHSKANTNDTIQEVESNNTVETAQALPLDVTLDYHYKYTTVTGRLDSTNDVDWFVVTLPERGELRFDGGNVTGYLPSVELYGKRVDGTFGQIYHTSHLKGEKVYIKLSTRNSFDVRDYTLRLWLGGNPVETDPHEPNDIFTLNHYEYYVIPKNSLFSTKWNTVHDDFDNFAITDGTNKGTLTFEVHYPEDEYNRWTSKKIDHYLVYRVYAEKKDGTFEKVKGFVQAGMKSQIYSQSLKIDNTNYTGKYVVSVQNNYKINPNYKIKINFISEPRNDDGAGNESNTVINIKSERIAGNDRYGTALEFTKKMAAKSLDTVILASGENFPDALAGGVLNKSLNGTVILVNDSEGKIQQGINETKRLLKENGKVIILGGEQAVSNKVENEFKKYFKVERIAGADRITTSIEIAKKANPNTKKVFLVYGYNFSDALSIVPYAAKSNTPIILNETQSLDKKVKEYLKQGITSVTIIGGNKVISNNIESELRNMGIQVNRISGSNRFQTALTIAKKYFENSKVVALANGYKFPDALSGSRFALDKDMPILLTDANELNTDVKNLINQKERVYIYGGEKSVSPDLFK
jgi:putative cell wall-binding protein